MCGGGAVLCVEGGGVLCGWCVLCGGVVCCIEGVVCCVWKGVVCCVWKG